MMSGLNEKTDLDVDKLSQNFQSSSSQFAHDESLGSMLFDPSSQSAFR